MTAFITKAMLMSEEKKKPEKKEKEVPNSEVSSENSPAETDAEVIVTAAEAKAAELAAQTKELEDRYKQTFNERGEHIIYSQCEWWFRTMGPNRRIVKLLDCKESDPQGTRGKGKPFAAYTLDQLPGKTIKLAVWLAEEERPSIGDTWVKFPNGWKRCLGKSFEDQDAYCFGNKTDFSTFKMVDGRVCTVYPGCTE